MLIPADGVAAFGVAVGHALHHTLQYPGQVSRHKTLRAQARSINCPKSLSNPSH
jgi:hypothetical protein